MKVHYIINALLLVITTIGLASCRSDIDPVYIDLPDGMTLSGASGDIILSPANPQALAMTIYWSGDGRLSLSDMLLQAPINAALETIELSRDGQFSTPTELSVEKGIRSRQFLSGELNALLERMGYVADEKSPLYIRIKSVLSANIAPTYSTMLKVVVQPYKIRLLQGIVLDKDQNETSMRLASPEENGIYQGFMGVNGWTNWWLREANNIVWGNQGEAGKTFHASSTEDHWNFWFPDPTGCYFTTLNAQEGWWSGLYIKNLSVTGDITGEMSYNIKANKWTLPVSLRDAAFVTIMISGKGALYNTTTTDMGPAIEKKVAFGGDCNKLTFGETADPITLQLPAGQSTLVLDLTNPLGLSIGAGEAVIEPMTAPRLYFSGIMNWDGFDDYLSLYDEETLAYGGAHWFDSEWGYRAYTQPDWAVAYKAGDGATATAGSLKPASTEGNIPAPERGLYVMDFRLKTLTYQLTKVETVTFTGLNDDWSEHPMVQSSDNPEVFSAEFVKEKVTPWGVKILINHDWGLFFGGGDGKLRLGHSDATTGFDGDNTLSVGHSYILTVDLGTQTYSYTPKRVP
jgi:hypothetical protein